MKLGFKILIGIVAIFAILAAVLFGIMTSQAKKEEIKFGPDKIKTMYAIVGKRDINGTEMSANLESSLEEIRYKEGVITADDIRAYTSYLKGEGYYITSTDDTNNAQYGVESKDSGKIILIDISFSNESTVITYRKGAGSITPY